MSGCSSAPFWHEGRMGFCILLSAPFVEVPLGFKWVRARDGFAKTPGTTRHWPRRLRFRGGGCPHRCRSAPLGPGGSLPSFYRRSSTRFRLNGAHADPAESMASSLSWSLVVGECDAFRVVTGSIPNRSTGTFLAQSPDRAGCTGGIAGAPREGCRDGRCRWRRQ